jgi:vacuolar-type H+-ATPase subunit F/Vma7
VQPAGRIAAVGEDARIAGLALAGVTTVAAEGRDAVRGAWAGLAADVALVLLTPAAAAALDDLLGDRSSPRLTVVLPP